MDIEKIVGKNWLNEREAVIQKERVPGGAESWLDCVKREFFINSAVSIFKWLNLPSSAEIFACQRLKNSEFCLVIYNDSNDIRTFEIGEFGITDLKTEEFYENSQFIHQVNILNAGRKIGGVTYSEAYKQFALNREANAFNEKLEQLRKNHDIVTDEYENYHNAKNFVLQKANELSHSAQLYLENVAEEQEKE